MPVEKVREIAFAFGYPELAPRVRLTVQWSVNAVTVSYPVQCLFNLLKPSGNFTYHQV
jgi:hypothetical protein